MALIRQNAKQCSQIKSIEYLLLNLGRKTNKKQARHYKYNMLLDLKL